jgi:plastocyanin
MDGTSHTVTSNSGSELDSPLLSSGMAYSHNFSTAGIYDYHCALHPFMKGKIIVE